MAGYQNPCDKNKTHMNFHVQIAVLYALYQIIYILP